MAESSFSRHSSNRKVPAKAIPSRQGPGPTATNGSIAGSQQQKEAQLSRAMNDIIKLSLLRHDDITQLRQLLRSLHGGMDTQTGATDGSGSIFGGLMNERTRAVVSRVHSNEASRQNREDNTLRMIAATDSTGIQKELHMAISKLYQITKRHKVLSSLIEMGASSHTHCYSVMQGYFERAEPMGNTISLFSAIMDQRKQIWQVIAIFETKRHQHSFFNLDNLVKQLFQTDTGAELVFAGQGADPMLESVDRVALSIAVKDAVLQRLLSHNRYVADERNKYKAFIEERKQGNKDVMTAPLVNLEKQASQEAAGKGPRESKGLQTLRLLEQQLGVKAEDQTKSIKDLAPKTQNSSLRKTNTSFRGTQSSSFSTANLGGLEEGAIMAISDEHQMSGLTNYAHNIQKDYMAQLEESYQNSKNVKKAKKLRVINCAKKIQRAYRSRIGSRQTRSCIMIQRHWRSHQEEKQKKQRANCIVSRPFNSIDQLNSFLGSLKDNRHETTLQKVRRSISVIKIQNFFRAKLRQRRARAPMTKIDKRFLMHEAKITKLQRRIRRWIFWKRLRQHRNHLIEAHRIFNMHKRFNRERTYWHRHLSVLQSRSIGLERQALQRRESIQAYMVTAINGFEHGWKIHSDALLKYELKQAKLTSYETGVDEEGKQYWHHKKTGEKTYKHPGHKYFNHNAKAMRQRAEEKFQKDVIGQVEYERETLEMKTEKERAEVARQVRLAHKRHIIEAYTFNF